MADHTLQMTPFSCTKAPIHQWIQRTFLDRLLHHKVDAAQEDKRELHVVVRVVVVRRLHAFARRHQRRQHHLALGAAQAIPAVH